jgi:hypothetical protein
MSDHPRILDFGESHYIGPLHDNNPSVYAGGDNGAVKWVKGYVGLFTRRTLVGTKD